MKPLSIGLWILQILMALVFGAHGWLMLAPPPEVAAQMNMPDALRLFIGIAEIAAAFGFILPAATRIMPMLTTAAAVGCIVIMVLSIPYHFMEGQTATVWSNFLILGLLCVLAYGRWKLAPIHARGAV